LSNTIPWFAAEEIYANKFNALNGSLALNVRAAPFGRMPKDPKVNAERKRQTRKDEVIQNAVEGKFGQGTDWFGVNLLMAKLAVTSETVVALIVMAMNLQKQLAVHFLRFFMGIESLLMAINWRYCLLMQKI